MFDWARHEVPADRRFTKAGLLAELPEPVKRLEEAAAVFSEIMATLRFGT